MQGVAQLTVPDDWGVRKVVQLADWLSEWQHVLGNRIEFPEWRNRFADRSSKAAALRQWERRKTDLRLAGIVFELVDSDHLDIRTAGTKALLFESQQYMRDMVEALAGPQDRYPDFKPRSYLKSIDDFGPAVAERYREPVEVPDTLLIMRV